MSEQIWQQTVGQSASLSGIALHTGVRAHLTLNPAPADSGIVFHRIDLPGAEPVPALAANVVDVRRGTTIAVGESKVYTVEHLLAALHAVGIDNVMVEMDGPEPPVLDGSAEPYLELIEKAGVKTQDVPVAYWQASEPINIAEGESELKLIPHDSLKITYSVAFGATPLDAQTFSSEIDVDVFRNQIAFARTFCLFRELEQMIAMGLVKGGSLDNAVVIHDGALISKEGLRSDNELVCHKVLDLIGDLYLVGSRIKAHITAVKSGHPTNVMLAQKMLAQMAG